MNIQVYCVNIDKTLRLPEGKCPLPQGACVWKHRVLNTCKYDPSVDTYNITNLANRLGAAAPSEAETESLIAKLRTAIKDELS